MKNTRKILSYKQGSERFLREKNTTIFLVNKKEKYFFFSLKKNVMHFKLFLNEE
jgi:hypothetical protein